MKEQIKELRVKVDGLAQLTKELKPIIKYPKNMVSHAPVGEVLPFITSNSKEIEKAVDSLYLAKAWLGKLLGELGNENPYGSGYKTKEDIVPTQDVSDSIESKGDIIIPNKDNELIGKHWSDLNHIEKVDWLRTEIEKIINIFTNDEFETGIIYIIRHQTSKPKIRISTIESNIVTHLCEARFHLGFELERLKNEK